MYKKTASISLIALLSIVSVCFGAPWNPRGNLNDTQSSRPQRGSAAYFTIKPKTEKRSGFLPSEHTKVFGNQQTPSSRGRGGTSTARLNTQPSAGDRIKEQQQERLTLLAQQRSVAPTRNVIAAQHPRNYSFTLNPNPTFKPFILQSQWKQSNDENQYKLWNPYSEGLFYQFGQ